MDFPRSNVARSTAKPLTLGLARSSYPTSVEGILAYYPCMCVMRYHDYAETNNAPVLPCTRQRLDLIAAADEKSGRHFLVHIKGWT